MPIAIVSNMEVVENESYMKANSVDKNHTLIDWIINISIDQNILR